MLIQVFRFTRVYIFAIALHFIRRFWDEILASHRHCLFTSTFMSARLKESRGFFSVQHFLAQLIE